MITALLFWFFAAEQEPPALELSTSRSQASAVYYWEATEEEVEEARQRGRAQLERLHRLQDAVYQEDYRAAPLLFEELIRVKSINADPNEPLEAALLRLSNYGITAMGDLYLDTGSYDDALKLAGVLAAKWIGLDDNTFLAEIIALRTSTVPPPGTGFAEAYLLRMNRQHSRDMQAYFDQNDGLQHDLSLLYTARGLDAQHESALGRAMHHFRRALEYDPDNTFAQLYYSRALYDSGSTEAGKQILRRLAESGFRQVAKEARRMLNRVGG